MGKLNINVTEEIRANADHTWSIVGHQFDDIGAWAAGVSSSQPITGATPPSPSAPSGGRVCQVGKPLGTLHEQLVSYDDSARRLVHTVTSEKMPGPVDDLTLTWTVVSDGPNASTTQVNIAANLSGIGGAIMGPMLKRQFTKNMTNLLSDLRVYAETGRQSPEKRDALAKAR